ncbi:MAG: TlyA family RNA methyltransferase [Turicibacter sp.]|nr:TlyA family RNA methyltransferase [Turicibacter sp.]
MSNSKERLDVLMTSLGLFESREAAKRAIMAGIVLVNDEPVDKAGTKVPVDAEIRLKGQVMPYVSRGGYKLEQAIKAFNLDLTDKIIIDVGASTGGFTDCALQNGARMSYAVDVGYNQLAWKLRQDERVLSMERTNFRHMQPADLAHGVPTFACMDVSFISIKLLLPVLKELLAADGEIVALIKPQFEAGKALVGKKGIVRDAKVHVTVIKDITAFVRELGLVPLGLTFSPIKGGVGNIEFLLNIGLEGEQIITDERVEEVVKTAHNGLK